jgi:hypothetical protein
MTTKEYTVGCNNREGYKGAYSITHEGFIVTSKLLYFQNLTYHLLVHCSIALFGSIQFWAEYETDQHHRSTHLQEQY